MGTVSVRSEVGLDDLEVSSNLEIVCVISVCMEFFGQLGSAILNLSPCSCCCVPILIASRTVRHRKVLGLL